MLKFFCFNLMSRERLEIIKQNVTYKAVVPRLLALQAG